MRTRTWTLFALSFLCQCYALSVENIDCHVVIVGGGAGGLHTAYQLSKLDRSDPNSEVCVIEKEQRLGGRIYDVALDSNKPDLLYGMGALRILESQHYLFKLADELGLVLERAPYRDDLISARGYFAFSSDEMNLLAYPLVTKDHIAESGTGTEEAFYDQIRHGPERQNVKNYADLRSYVRAILGPQAFAFLTDVFRFRAEFEVPIDLNSYLDYLDEEWGACCVPYYPVGGMSAFIRGMTNGARSRGVRFFLGQPVETVSSKPNKRGYEIRTPRFAFSASRVVFATEPFALNYMKGNIVEAIKRQDQFRDIFGIRVVTMGQKWPRAWWLESGYEGKDVRRAWTTEHCLNFIEIPINPYAAEQKVTRSVYDDDMRCTRFWENTYQRLGIRGVESEIMRGLKYLFPNAEIPQPINTVFQVWPNAWHYLKSGTRFRNKEIADWAIEPIPKEDVSLVGEAYFIQRSGWSEAAYKSSVNTLNAKFGLSIEIPHQ